MVQNSPEDYDMADVQINNKSDFLYTVSPNSSNDFLNITYSLDAEMPLSIELVDLFGQKIKMILPKHQQQAGSHALQMPISELYTGTYFLIISSNNQTKTVKIIVNKKNR